MPNNHVAEWLPYFEAHKTEIEKEIGATLVWDPNPKNRDKIITLFKQFDLKDKENWDEAIEWMAQYTLKFRSVFMDLIKKK